jgi:hypothetical protein
VGSFDSGRLSAVVVDEVAEGSGIGHASRTGPEGGFKKAIELDAVICGAGRPPSTPSEAARRRPISRSH